MKNLIIIIFSIFTVYIFSQDLTITAMDEVHQDSGNRTIETLVQFPEDISNYNQIIMRIHLNCPNGGCDPWDRKAYISIENFDNWIEIGRYVTPYGVSCGWEIDVTDFKSILHGNVNLKSHIDTWVSPGWLVNINFDYYLGNSEFEYAQVRNVWNRGQVIYGDPTQPVEISDVSEYIFSDVEQVKLKITTTGHGQGNTDNAAEFSNQIHEIVINDINTIDHNFWRSDCAQNDCSPQNGTWQYNRAGFCPGDISPPIEFDLTPYITSGDVVDLQYILENYTNYCSPNYSGCINGQNGCSTCSYNNSTHTEPFYFISSQLIQYSQNYHTNADVFLKIDNIDLNNYTISIYMENSVPVYGVQFEIDTEQLNPIEPPFNYEMVFGNPQGGRAEEAGWTIQTNESGTIIGLSLSGEYISAGEGVLTNIQWSIEGNNPMEGIIDLDIDEISGYFGESLNVEKGEPLEVSVLNNQDYFNLPERFKLFNTYPNPFNPVTNIKYSVPKNTNVSIKVYDINGNMIKEMYTGNQIIGTYNISWNADNQPSGLYFVKMDAGEFTQTQKLMLVK